MDDNQSYVFNQKFEGKIWKILPDASGKHLAIEVRNESKHQVSFFILDIYKKEWLWEDVIFEEQWWINLKAFTQGKLQFVYYEDGHSPEQKQYLVIDIHTREVKERHISMEEPDELSGSVIPPLHYLESNHHFNTVADFLKQKLNISPVKAVDYLEIQGLIVISYYIWESDHLANFLLVIDQKGTIKMHELLADKLSMIGIDTFFVIRKSLYTIRQKAEILIYGL